MAILEQGSSGSDVFKLQKMLRALGYDTEENGYFGPLTKAAVLHFQSVNGLTLDGIVGPETMSALGAAISPETVSPPVAKTTGIAPVARPGIKPSMIGSRVPYAPAQGISGYYKYGLYALGAVFAFLIIKRIFGKK